MPNATGYWIYMSLKNKKYTRIPFPYKTKKEAQAAIEKMKRNTSILTFFKIIHGTHRISR